MFSSMMFQADLESKILNQHTWIHHRTRYHQIPSQQAQPGNVGFFWCRVLGWWWWWWWWWWGWVLQGSTTPSVKAGSLFMDTLPQHKHLSIIHSSKQHVIKFPRNPVPLWFWGFDKCDVIQIQTAWTYIYMVVSIFWESRGSRKTMLQQTVV